MKSNRITSAGTEADSTATAQVTTSNHNSSKPRVSRRLSDFSQGFACACAVTLNNHGCNTEVEDTFMCNFMSIGEMRRRGVDENDINTLRPIVKEIERKQRLSNGG